MGKINEGLSSGNKNPLSNEYKLETELFKDDIDEMRGSTIGIEAVRDILPKFNVGEKDSFNADQKPDLGADGMAYDDTEYHRKKKEEKADTGLTFQLKGQLRGHIKG
jgi:hypothetical protein